MDPLTQAQTVRRVVDRLAFGLPAHDLDALTRRGPDGAARALLGRAAPAPTPPEFEQVPERVKGESTVAKKARRVVLRANSVTLATWWLTQLITSPDPARERLTWFWHGHFATSIQKVRLAQLMLTQNQTFRSLGGASFGPLAHALIVDPALMVWLDAPKNCTGSPNENLAREYLELFTLGHGNYTEADVTAAARALTGFTLQRDGGTAVARLRPRRHDSGQKTLLGRSGDLGADDVVDLALAQPASSTFVISRLWARFVSHQPPTAAQLEPLRAAYGADRRVDELLLAMVATPGFSAPEFSLVKEPVLWLTGLARQLGLTVQQLTAPVKAGRQATLAQAVLAGLNGMGQVPLRPPSVGGWPSGRGWLSSGTAAARLALATRVAAAAAPKLTGTTRARVAAAGRLLGVDAWSNRTADALAGVADRPAQLVALAACSPEYIVSR